MDLPTKQLIYTGSKWFGQKIYIEATGDKEDDAALKSTFHDGFHRTKPLRMQRRDVSLLVGRVIESQELKSQTGVPVAEQKAGQLALWERID